MDVVAVVNRKGGVGKTTTAVNVAAALAIGGQRTLVVDLDPQGSAGRALGVEAQAGAGSSVLFRTRAPVAVTYPAVPTLFRLGVLCADEPLAEVDLEVLRDPARRKRLGERLRRLREHWGVVVLDTPPALGGLSGAALRAADAVLVPVAADFLAVDALRGTLAAIRAAEKTSGRPYTPLALLPTFVDEHRRRARDTVALMRESFGELVLRAEIPRSARFDSAALAGRPVVVTAPGSAPARAYAEAARELLARLGDGAAKRRGVKSFVRADMREALIAIRRADE